MTGAPVFVPLLSLLRSDLYMENYWGCQGLFGSLTEQRLIVRMVNKG
jgi:hypothetical protein